MQTLSVKLLSCKILKTKNCVSFEVQYYSNVRQVPRKMLKQRGIPMVLTSPSGPAKRFNA